MKWTQTLFTPNLVLMMVFPLLYHVEVKIINHKRETL